MAVRLAYTEEADPHAYGGLQLFREWFYLAEALRPQRAALHRAWSKVLGQLNNCKAVRGRGGACGAP